MFSIVLEVVIALAGYAATAVCKDSISEEPSVFQPIETDRGPRYGISMCKYYPVILFYLDPVTEWSCLTGMRSLAHFACEF